MDYTPKSHLLEILWRKFSFLKLEVRFEILLVNKLTTIVFENSGKMQTFWHLLKKHECFPFYFLRYKIYRKKLIFPILFLMSILDWFTVLTEICNQCVYYSVNTIKALLGCVNTNNLCWWNVMFTCKNKYFCFFSFSNKDAVSCWIWVETKCKAST